jgi:ribosomal protein S27E
MDDRLSVKCPKCGWEFYAAAGLPKVKCQNPECEEVIATARKGEAMDAARRDDR